MEATGTPTAGQRNSGGDLLSLRSHRHACRRSDSQQLARLRIVLATDDIYIDQFSFLRLLTPMLYNVTISCTFSRQLDKQFGQANAENQIQRFEEH